MTPQTTFVGGINPWSSNPMHRPRPWAAEPEPEPAPVVVMVVKGERKPSHRTAVLELIQQMGSASGKQLMDAMDLSKSSVNCALRGLRRENRIRIKTVPIANRRPSYLYFPL